jgi:hypothetical protein
VALIGASEMGISSLLGSLYASRDEWRPGVPVLYLDLRAILNDNDFCETILTALGETGEDLRALKRALSGREVVLLFDEVKRLAERDISTRLLDLLRSLTQEPGLALCAAAERPLTELFPARTGVGISPLPQHVYNPLYGIVKRYRMPPIPVNDRLASGGLSFTPVEIERLIEGA